MYEFKYHRPATVRQAANLLVKNEDAKVIAGGHTLLPVMKRRSSRRRRLCPIGLAATSFMLPMLCSLGT